MAGSSWTRRVVSNLVWESEFPNVSFPFSDWDVPQLRLGNVELDPKLVTDFLSSVIGRWLRVEYVLDMSYSTLPQLSRSTGPSQTLR